MQRLFSAGNRRTRCALMLTEDFLLQTGSDSGLLAKNIDLLAEQVTIVG